MPKDSSSDEGIPDEQAGEYVRIVLRTVHGERKSAARAVGMRGSPMELCDGIVPVSNQLPESPVNAGFSTREMIASPARREDWPSSRCVQ